MSTALAELGERVAAAAAAGRPLRIRGGGSKDFYGGETAGETLDARAWTGIVAYEPTELYLRARGGTPLRELAEALDAQGQMLAFEPPAFGDATAGGMVASGLSGPRRVQAGPLRDFVLGVELIDGRGERLRFGGQVMKNVAGYDVSRLMAGSLGTLGLITEVTLKVLPRPAAELSLRLALDQAGAIRRLNEWAGRPLPISASAWHDGVLTVRLSGATAAVRHARTQLGGDPLHDVEAREFWEALREQMLPFFRAPLWRLSLPSTAPPLTLRGDVLIEWHGGLRWLVSDADAGEIRAAVQAAGGTATLFRAAPDLKRHTAVFHPLPPAAAALHRRIKQVFDPAGVFNRGRLYADL